MGAPNQPSGAAAFLGDGVSMLASIAALNTGNCLAKTAVLLECAGEAAAGDLPPAGEIAETYVGHVYSQRADAGGPALESWRVGRAFEAAGPSGGVGSEAAGAGGRRAPRPGRDCPAALSGPCVLEGAGLERDEECDCKYFSLARCCGHVSGGVRRRRGRVD